MLLIRNLLNLIFDFLCGVTEIAGLWAENILCSSFVISVICMDMCMYVDSVYHVHVFLCFLRSEFRPILCL